MAWQVRGSTVLARPLAFGVLSLPAAASSALAQECVVSGKQVVLDSVVVHPANAEPFEVSIGQVPNTARIRARAGQPAEIDVAGAIAFKGTAKSVWYTIATPIETNGGVMRLSPGAHLVDAGDGDGVNGSVVMYAEDVLEGGEGKEPDETVGPVHVLCNALTLDWLDIDAEVPSASDGTCWTPRRGAARLELRSSPSMSADVLTYGVLHSDCDGCVVVEGIERRGDWLHVGRTGERSYVSGWVRRAELEKIQDGECPPSRVYGCLGDHGAGEHGVSHRGAPKELYEGPVRLRRNTAIFTEPDGSPWAAVERDDTFRVRYVRGDAWAQLTSIPGLVGLPWALDAYVGTSNLILPAPTNP